MPNLFVKSSRLGPAALALLAGASAALAFPPFGILPGLLGYGLLLGLFDRTGGERPLRSAFWRGFLAGTAYFAIGCWWVAEAFLVDAAEQGWMAPFAVALLAMGLGLFWGAAGALYRLLRPTDSLLKVLVFAGVLSLLEWLRGHILTGFPWDLPGETWRAGSAPSQMAALVGAYGLSWITVAAMGALAAPFAFGLRRTTWGVFAGGLAALAALYGFGLERLAHARPVPANAPIVRVVQADVRQESKYDQDLFDQIVRRYLRLTAGPPKAGRVPAVVIWPEGALPDSVNALLQPQAWTYQAIVKSLRPGQVLLMGGYREDPSVNIRPTYYNSLIALRRSEGYELEPVGVYDKFRLVPFGEYTPMDKLMTAIGFKALTHVAEDGFTPGPLPRPLRIAGLPRLQPLICYESLFPGLARRGASLGGGRADWIVNISNDAWFGETSGPLQHLNLASYRAIEEGLPMVRATPTGVSAVIDAYGRPRPGQSLPLGAMGVIDAALPPPLAPTPFSRWGGTGFWLMMALSASALAPAVRRAR